MLKGPSGNPQLVERIEMKDIVNSYEWLSVSFCFHPMCQTTPEPLLPKPLSASKASPITCPYTTPHYVRTLLIQPTKTITKSMFWLETKFINVPKKR